MNGISDIRERDGAEADEAGPLFFRADSRVASGAVKLTVTTPLMMRDGDVVGDVRRR